MLDKIHTTLVENAPKFLKLPAKLVPPQVHQLVMLETLSRIFREAIVDGDFEFLDGRWLHIHVRDLDIHHFISFAEEKLVVAKEPQAPDVTFSGDLNDLILVAARKEDPDTLFFQRRLSIEGDTELGLEVKNLMDSIDLNAMPAVPRKALLTLAEFIQSGLQKAAIETEQLHDVKS